MDVATIIANIKSQALVGNTGAADDDDRILRYLNKGYTKVYSEISRLNPNLYQQTQEVTIADGLGDYDEPVFFLISVADKNNGYRQLSPKLTVDIEAEDPALAMTGSPCTYDPRLNGLTTYPLNDTTLRIRFVPPPNTLTANSMEEDIKIPSTYHEVLEWATLWTIAYDERDKLVGQELNFTQATYEGLMEGLKMFVLSLLPKANRRVKGVM